MSQKTVTAVPCNFTTHHRHNWV